MPECPICNRNSLDSELFCEYHHVAYEKLKLGFNEWKKALDLDWKSYLLRVYEVDGLGMWIQEIIDSIMLQESP
ncbi:MAG: hypothetical protein PVG65_05495 [Candidatus Thorarchaeota archaeon]|jgi:hypothetical protein